MKFRLGSIEHSMSSLTMATEISICNDSTSDSFSFNNSSFIELEAAPRISSSASTTARRESLTEIERIKTILDQSVVSGKKMSENDTRQWPKKHRTRVQMSEGVSIPNPPDAHEADSDNEEEMQPDYSEIDGRKLLAVSNGEDRDHHHLPHNVNDFLARLESYDIIRWNCMPDCISAFHCARFGWKLCRGGRAVDVLICVTCKACLVVPSPKKKRLEVNQNEAKEFRKLLESSQHQVACIWRKVYSPLTILTLPKHFELFQFLVDSLMAFKKCDIDFQLKPSYEQVLENLDLKWMLNLLGDKSKDLTDSGRLLFLTLNGWYHRDEILECTLCLRKVPLLTFKKVENVEEINKSYLDPVNNHHWYCPWRKFLQFATAADVMPSKDPEHVSFYERRFEDSAYLRPYATAQDYDRLKQHFLHECHYASSFRAPKVEPKLVYAVSEVMDGWMSTSLNCSTLQSSLTSTPKSEVGLSPCSDVVVVSPQLKRGVKRKLPLFDPDHSSVQD